MTKSQVIFLHLSTLLTALTGLLFAVMKYGLTTDDPYAVVNHPLQPWMLSAHVVVAPFFVFAIGWIFADHIWPRFLQKSSPKRRSGIPALAMLLPMTLSGYLLQVSASDAMRRAMSIVHWATSGAFVVAYLAHLSISFLMSSRSRA